MSEFETEDVTKAQVANRNVSKTVLIKDYFCVLNKNVK